MEHVWGKRNERVEGAEGMSGVSVSTCTCRMPHMACDRKKKGTRVPHLEKKHSSEWNGVSATDAVLCEEVEKAGSEGPLIS